VIEHHVVVQTLYLCYSVRNRLGEGRRYLRVILPQIEHLIQVRSVDCEVEPLEVLGVEMSWTVSLSSTVENEVKHGYY